MRLESSMATCTPPYPRPLPLLPFGRGDLLVVDRAVEVRAGLIVIAALGGELTVKRLVRRGERLPLAPENPDYPCFDVTSREDFEIWGVVTHVIRKA